MAKQRAVLWPFKIRISYLVLALSLLTNILFISFVVYANSRLGDEQLYSTAYQHVCDRDYDWVLTKTTTPDQRILFSEGVCNRDAKTGGLFDSEHFSIVNGHYVVPAH